MSASTWTDDGKVVDLGTSNASGIATANIDVSTLANPSAVDQILDVYVKCFGATASGSHLVGTARLSAMGSFQYKGSPATLSTITAESGSTNPLQSNTTGFLDTEPQCADGGTIGGTSKLELSVSGTNIVITATMKNPGGAALSGVRVFVKWRMDRWGLT